MRMEPDLGGAQDMGQGLLTSKKGLIVRIGRQIAVRLDQYVAGDQVERSQVARYRVESNVFRHMGRRPDRRIDDDLLSVVQGETKPEPRLMNCEGDKPRAHRPTDQQHPHTSCAITTPPIP